MAHGKSRKLNRGGPCVQCGATQSTLFRRSPEGTMCNPCGLRHKRQQQRQQRESIEGVGEGSSDQLSAERCASEDTEQLLVENKPVNASEPLISSEEHKVCSLCATDSSPLWRSVDGNLACNKCALRARRKGKRQSDTPTEELSEEIHTIPPTPKRRASSQVWHQGLTGEPAPPAIDSYVRELANCGHITEADMRMYLCLWTELNDEQRRMAREAVTAARDEGDVAGGADHVRLVVGHNEMQYGRPALINMVNELMGSFDDGCRGGTAPAGAAGACNGEGGLIMA